jgi:hypothetical protein
LMGACSWAREGMIRCGHLGVWPLPAQLGACDSCRRASACGPARPIRSVGASVDPDGSRAPWQARMQG